MKDQIIITMGREHGSGGHYIADMIARELGIKLYDKDSIPPHRALFQFARGQRGGKDL